MPRGWSSVFGVASRADFLTFIETEWTDMRPKSPIAAMERDGSDRPLLPTVSGPACTGLVSLPACHSAPRRGCGQRFRPARTAVPDA
ncbi:hypothetical protein [Nocardia sp. BSTN01]|uniref:hypothetical protein n=1 Tax=Nocardia sp. BSTN01 TaxID=2783665 RepID=UPI0035CD175A